MTGIALKLALAGADDDDVRDATVIYMKRKFILNFYMRKI